MRETVGIGAADDGHVVHASGQVGIQVGDFGPRFPRFSEFMAGGQKRAGISDFEKRVFIEIRNRLAMVFG